MAEVAEITGGCACGSVRYRSTGEPVLSVNCHCRACQRATGSAFAPIVVVWKDDFEHSGDPPAFYVKDPDDDHYLHRGFCAKCGSPTFMTRPERPKLVYIIAGSLDTPESYAPAMNIFTAEAHDWDLIDPELDGFPAMPPVPDDLGR